MAIAPNSTRPGRDLIAGSYHCFIWSLLSLERDNANRANMCWGAIDLLGKQEPSAFLFDSTDWITFE